jgi:ketosteroid isomerase-like protein
MTQSNAELIRSGYAAFGRGDVPAVLAIFAEDIRWHVPGRNPMSGDYAGHEEVVGYFQALGERSGGTFRLEVNDILDSDDGNVTVLATERGERNGAHLNSSAVHVWHLEDGRATTFRGFQEDLYEFDEFWS